MYEKEALFDMCFDFEPL